MYYLFGHAWTRKQYLPHDYYYSLEEIADYLKVS
jgi:hypothetical protein